MRNMRSNLANANQPVTLRACKLLQEEQRMYKVLQSEIESPEYSKFNKMDLS